MEKDIQDYQECCLYFTANTLSRKINQLAEEAFATTGLAPSYAYLVMLVADHPGSNQQELCKKMQVQPSTMVRFVEKLVQQEYVTKEQAGRITYIHPTPKAKKFRPKFNKALDELYTRYTAILGEKFAVALTADMFKANKVLEA